MRRLAPCLCLLLLAAGAARAQDEAPAPPALGPDTRDFDQLSLLLRVEPDLEHGTIDGRATLAFEPLVEGLTSLRLHCEDTRILAVVGEDARPLTWTLENGTLRVDLSEPLPRGRGSTVTVAYRSTPRRGLYFHRPTERYPDTPRLMYSQGESNDNRRWVPCYDLPDDRFRWDLVVTVPADLETVSNGRLVEQTETGDGLRRDHWRFEDEAPSYLLSLIVGDLQTVTDAWRDTRLEYTAVPGHEEELRTALGETPAMMEVYSTWLDEPYPWSRYAQTFVWDFIYGGMENVTATTLNMRALHTMRARPSYTSEGLVAHELAHMWFGDLITCRTWDDIWLNEGFATYLTDLYVEAAHGRDEFLLRRRDQNRGYMDGSPRPENLGLTRNPRGDRPLELFGGKQYSRGAAILHMLRLELGDELFQRAIRAYVDRFRHGTATSEDLRRTVQDVAGRDLAWFWDQWVYGAGYPVLQVAWDPKSRRVDVRQVQGRGGGQGLFRLTLPVRIGATGPVERLRIWRDHHVFVLPEPPQGAADYLRAGVGGDLLARIRLGQGLAAWERVLAEDPDVTGRLDAADALEDHGALAAPALAKALAGDASWAVRARAAELLGRMDTDLQALQALAGAVGDEDARVREAVYEALGARGRDEAGSVLAAGVSRETHDHPLAAAARALGRVQADGAWDVLTGLLSRDSHDDVVRAGALDGLRALGDVRGAARAREYCDYAWGGGGTQRLRKSALDCMTALAPDARETRALLVELLDDPHHAMRQWAAEACGVYEVRDARPRLEALARDDWNGGVRNAARQALDRMK